MPKPTRTVLIGALLLGAACESPTDQRAKDNSELRSLPRALSTAEQHVIAANNRFAFGLLRETLGSDAGHNVFLSPLSASMALGMTMNGARDATLDGMRTALGFGDLELSAINASYRDLIDLLRNLDHNVDMRVANSIWARDGYPFHESFLQTNRQFFDAEVSGLDFNAPGAAATIDRWVKEHTGGKIEKIAPDPIPANVVMFLLNAIYFQGDWQQSFDRARTVDASFTRADGSTKPIRLMNRRGSMLQHHDAASGAQLVELLYGRGAFAMTIVLPAPGTPVRTLAAQLDAARWQQWTDALQEADVMLSLPRFRVEYETLLNGPLITLGMAAAFNAAPGTDFSGMSPNGKELWISQVKQKTYIDVNEEGTTAAAVTSVVMVDSAPPAIVIDRPFLLALRERFSGTILFLGIIGDPQ